jgi:putative nucleotidyltransferase with HDIG domain
MIENIENIIRELVSTLQVARIYTVAHPRFQDAATKSYELVNKVVRQRGELVIGIIGEELAFEKEIFFQLSAKLGNVIRFLKSRGIEKIIFHKELTKEEWIKFISFLADPKADENVDSAQLLFLLGVKNISIGKIQGTGVPESKSAIINTISYLQQYSHSLESVSQSVEDIVASKDLNYLEIKFTLAGIMDNLLAQSTEFLKLITIKKYDTITFSHLLNTAVLTMYFSSKLGLSQDDCLDLGVAALYHDIGKVHISRAIIQKTGQLTDGEFDAMKSHTILGAETLLRYTDTFGVLPVVVALEHHLKYDLSGYPKQAFACKPHFASLVVSICDVYDALTQRRTYKRNFPPQAIFNIMIKERGRLFEPDLVDKFFQAVGVWPVGSIVRLSDNRVAVVNEINPQDIFSPRVEIIGPDEKKEKIDLITVKDYLKIVNALNPLSDGKGYIDVV